MATAITVDPLADADLMDAAAAFSVDDRPPAACAHSRPKPLFSRSLYSAVSSWIVHLLTTSSGVQPFGSRPRTPILRNEPSKLPASRDRGKGPQARDADRIPDTIGRHRGGDQGSIAVKPAPATGYSTARSRFAPDDLASMGASRPPGVPNLDLRLTEGPSDVSMGKLLVWRGVPIDSG